jgi:hypothetical protein
VPEHVIVWAVGPCVAQGVAHGASDIAHRTTNTIGGNLSWPSGGPWLSLNHLQRLGLVRRHRLPGLGTAESLANVNFDRPPQLVASSFPGYRTNKNSAVLNDER